MSIKGAQNDFTSKMKDFDNFTKIALKYGDLGKIVVAHACKSCTKCNKLSNLVTLLSPLRSFVVGIS